MLAISDHRNRLQRPEKTVRGNGLKIHHPERNRLTVIALTAFGRPAGLLALPAFRRSDRSVGYRLGAPARPDLATASFGKLRLSLFLLL